MYAGTAGMKAQMKYADKRGAPLVVIQGGDEKAKGEVQIKDLRLGAELASNIASHEEYASQRLAQFSVPEADLVAAVKKALARVMAGKSSAERAALERQNAAVMAVFERAGFDHIAPDIIQPADIFLERSGEDIRARTFVFTDPSGAEMCLRPDLTVPACRYHLSHAERPVRPSGAIAIWAPPSAFPTSC